MRTAKWALPDIKLEICNGCGSCVEQCPPDAVEMFGEGPAIVRPADCTYCALCETICPQDAISMAYEIVWGELDVGTLNGTIERERFGSDDD